MKFVLSGFFLLCVMSSGQPSGWRAITPLHSTCADVKKILKVDVCSLPISEYTVPDYRVRISFANDDCDSSPRAWRVPKGTVLSLVISPQRSMTVSQFGIDLAQFKKREGEEIVGLEQYDNDEEGVSVELFKGYVLKLTLGPRKGDARLRCKPPTQAGLAQTDPTCCDPEASDAIKQAWQQFTADGRYRLVARSDMRWREPKARGFAYGWSSLGFDRHESGYYHLAAIVVDTQRTDSNRFGLVIFSAPSSDNGRYRPFWVFRDRDLADSHIVEYLGLLDLMSENEHGSMAECKIQWDGKNGRYVCR